MLDNLKTKADAFVDACSRYFYQNTTQAFRYILIVLGSLVVVAAVMFAMPDNFMRGIGDEILLQRVENKKDAEYNEILYQVKIRNLPDYYNTEQTSRYWNKIAEFVKKHPTQTNYGILTAWAQSQCDKPMNPPSKLLFNKVKGLLNTPEIESTLNAENSVRLSNINYCRPFLDNKEERAIISLENRRLLAVEAIQRQKEVRKLYKERYGNSYDLETGKFVTRYKSDEMIQIEREDRATMEENEYRLQQIDNSIRSLREDIEIRKEKEKRLKSIE